MTAFTDCQYKTELLVSFHNVVGHHSVTLPGPHGAGRSISGVVFLYLHSREMTQAFCLCPPGDRLSFGGLHFNLP